MKSKCCGADYVIGELHQAICEQCGKADPTTFSEVESAGKSAADEILKKCFDNPPISFGLRTIIELEALITEREGMVAENKQYYSPGYEPQYDVSSFYSLAAKIRELLKGER